MLVAIVGFGAIAMTAAAARPVARDPAQLQSPSARAYFTPGPNWPARAVYLVPVLGAVLPSLGRHDRWWGEPWLLVGWVLWLAAVGVARFVVWPAEQTLQEAVGAAAPTADVAATARRLGRGALAIDVMAVAAVVVMVAKP